ncbi:MAG: hypothetical protein ABIJ91_01900 [Candidatus Kuenenbacteria bacterium]
MKKLIIILLTVILGVMASQCFSQSKKVEIPDYGLPKKGKYIGSISAYGKGIYEKQADDNKYLYFREVYKYKKAVPVYGHSKESIYITDSGYFIFRIEPKLDEETGKGTENGSEKKSKFPFTGKVSSPDSVRLVDAYTGRTKIWLYNKDKIEILGEKADFWVAKVNKSGKVLVGLIEKKYVKVGGGIDILGILGSKLFGAPVLVLIIGFIFILYLVYKFKSGKKATRKKGNGLLTLCTSVIIIMCVIWLIFSSVAPSSITEKDGDSIELKKDVNTVAYWILNFEINNFPISFVIVLVLVLFVPLFILISRRTGIYGNAKVAFASFLGGILASKLTSILLYGAYFYFFHDKDKTIFTKYQLATSGIFNILSYASGIIFALFIYEANTVSVGDKAEQTATGGVDMK